MSLINEALKKAQKQRSGEAPPLASMPSIGGQSPANIARGAGSARAKSLLVPVGTAAAALGLVVAGAAFLFRSKPAAVATSPAPAVRPEAPAATHPPPVVAAEPPSPAATAKATPAKAENVFVLPVATAPVAPPKTEPLIAAAPAPARIEPPAPAPQPVPETAKAPPPKLAPRAINYIESLRVAGIRASTTDPKDSKVLMNDRVYRVGNLVEPEMGLRLVGITADSLTFEDEHGGRYTRTF
jgi:hypothetical protein